MLLVGIFSGLTFLVMIMGVLFFPVIKIGKIKFASYWFISLIGAILIVLISKIDARVIIDSLTKNSQINPIKILTLFISMAVISIFLDELGFFKYLASVTLKKAKGSQLKLFLYLYIIVSILTVFTSNDIIILSFTPFICYFCKNAKINPLPYLTLEFVAANTWSMALIIGNPTNIYLASSYSVDFISYFKVMFVPTIISGAFAFILLFLVYKKSLKESVNVCSEVVEIKDKPNLIIGLICLGLTTLFLAISSYINVEMWLVSFVMALALFVIVIILSIIRKVKPIELKSTLKRAPYELIPFMLSMFVIIIVLNEVKLTNLLASLIGDNFATFKYGVLSFLASNVINNIPMSALFSSLVSTLGENVLYQGLYASIIGSNLGALFTPIGALAGIMYSSILNKNGIKYCYLSFLKMGVLIALPTLVVALFSLSLFI